MYSLIAFATQWGSKHGGINSFNTDFLTAFGVAYHRQAQVICIVASATPEEIEVARNAHVTLVPLPYPPQEKLFSAAQAQAGIEKLQNLEIRFNPDHTVWLGHDRITGAAAIAAKEIAGGRAALIHHMSYDHYESYAENSNTAYQKSQDQKTLFQQANLVLAIGPLLRDALIDLVSTSKPVHMLIPGLAEIETRPAPKMFTAFLSGRLSDDAVRIKQGHLGIAAFAKAHREARENSMPDGLCQEPKLVLRGVDFDSTSASSQTHGYDPETELKKFAQEYAQGVINLQALPYTQDRQELYEQLSAASVALMPSWHEGFGLVAWEAIAAGVPLIISKKSGVYRLLEEEFPAGPGCVYPIQVDGAVEHPFFSQDDLKRVADTLKNVANKIADARKRASNLRELVSKYSWPACAEKAAEIFEWQLQKGSIPADMQGQITSTPLIPITPNVPAVDSPLHMPSKRWHVGGAVADSQLLRAEEALVPFDPARQPELDALNTWLDDAQYLQAIRLMTGAGGLGKTRLALELCKQRSSNWHAGLLDHQLEANDMCTTWRTLLKLNQPLLIVIDYSETRQIALLALIKAMLQTPGVQPVRLLLLARDGGEWWDSLPGKDRDCESFLSSYATSGPYVLPMLHAEIQDRRLAYKRALQAFALALGAIAPSVVPELAGEHFGRPLYLQMAALLALHGERPTTTQGLTKALLNHERRYWHRSLLGTNLAEPERYAEQLLALTTLAGGFPTPKSAQRYWRTASGHTISTAIFNHLFHALEPLYPGKQGLQTVRPDLLGEALVAQALRRPSAPDLLDAVLANDASQPVRRHALTVLARLSGQHHDLHETLVETLVRHFAHCCHDIVAVATETTSDLPELAKAAFSRLTTNVKNQVGGLLKSHLYQESVQLGGFYCLVADSLVAKCREKLKKRTSDVESMRDYAGALINHAQALSHIGRNDHARTSSREALNIFGELNVMNRQRFEPDYATSLGNYATRLSEAGQDAEALKHARQALDIRQRLAQNNPDRYEPVFARSLGNCANHLSKVGQDDEVLKYARQALEIDQRLAQNDPDQYEPDFATSLSNYSSYLSDVGQNEEAIKHARQALEIRQRLVQNKLDRYEPDFATSLSNYANQLGKAGQNEDALKHARQALEIRQRLAQKNPDRYEPDFATSLSNYAGQLSEAGQDEEALKNVQQALEINRRLAQKNMDRYESHFASSLSNCANHLSNVGQDEEALKHAQQALVIYRNLAQKNPARFTESLFSSSCSTQFLGWLNDHGDESNDWVDWNTIQASVRVYRHSLSLLYQAFVQACHASNDQLACAEAFKRVITRWGELSQADRISAQDYWLCAAAWCAKFEPPAVENSDWLANWHQYVNRRTGRLPHWMQKLAQRLDFQWPE